METEGNLQNVVLYRLLRQVSALRKTGILTVQSVHDMLAVTFLEGEIVAADAMNETMEEGLGQVLESQGLVSPGQFSKVVAQQQASGERLADLLLKSRLVGREQLLEAIRLQTYRLLLDLLRWQEGEFNLFLGEEISYEDGIQPIAVEELLVRSAGDLGVEGPLHGNVPHVGGVFERSAGGRSIRVLGRDGEDPLSDPDAVWLTLDEAQVLERIDGQKAASALLDETGLDDYGLRFALHQLAEAELIRPAPSKPPEIVVPASGLTPATSLLRDDIDERLADDAQLLEPVPPAVSDVSAQLEGSEVGVRPTERARPDSLGVIVWVWLTRAFGLALVLLVLTLLPSRTARQLLYFPYPWQATQRSDFESAQRSALYHKIDRASRTYYLLYGRFPEELGLLADLQLLAPADLYDPQGNWISYSTNELAYTLQPLEDGVPVPGGEGGDDITDDVILNPQVVELSTSRNERPLVLLD